MIVSSHVSLVNQNLLHSDTISDNVCCMDRRALAKRIGEIRGRQSQAEFAQRFGVSRQSVVRWENGDYPPPDEVLAKLHIRHEYVEEGRSERCYDDAAD